MGKKKEDSELHDYHEKVGERAEHCAVRRRLSPRSSSESKFSGRFPPGPGDARAVFTQQVPPSSAGGRASDRAKGLKGDRGGAEPISSKNVELWRPCCRLEDSLCDSIVSIVYCLELGGFR